MIKESQLKREQTRIKDLGLPSILLRKLMQFKMNLNTFVWKDYVSTSRILNAVYVDMKLSQLTTRVNIGAVYAKGSENWFLALETAPGVYDFYTEKRFVTPYYKDLTMDQALRRFPKDKYELFFIPSMQEQQSEISEEILEEEIPTQDFDDSDIDQDLITLERELDTMPMAANKKASIRNIVEQIKQIID